MATAATMTPPPEQTGRDSPDQESLQPGSIEGLVLMGHSEVEWDWTSKYPLTHLTFILNTFIPAWHPLVKMSGEVMEKKRKTLELIKDDFKDSPDMKLIFTGSFYENVSVPTYFKRVSGRVPKDDEYLSLIVWSDVDVMVESVGKAVGHGKGMERQVDTSSTRPGYMRVLYSDDTKTGDYFLRKDGKVYLSSSKIMEDFQMQMTMKILSNSSNPDYAGLISSQHGPALTMEKSGRLDHDWVIALPHPEWPEQAKEWCSRERPSGWPPEKVREDIIKCGTHVVPVAHRNSSWSEAEWRFSFAQAESKLCHTLTITQRQCYMLMKTIVKFELTPANLVTSYCLKNLFFRLMERIPSEQWEDKVNGLAATFLCFMDELMYALIRHDLPHYFVSKNNLIAHIHEDFLDDLMAKVSKIRRDPVKYLMGFDKIYVFPYSPLGGHFSDVWKPVLDHCKEYSTELRQCTAEQFKSLKILLFMYIQQCNFEGTWEVNKQICSIFSMFTGRQVADPMAQLEQHLLDLPAHHAIRFYEYFVAHLPHVQGSVYGNMACMYTSLYSTETDDAKKTDYAEKAHRNFQNALRGDKLKAASVVDYTVFLRKSKQAAAAIPLLLKVLPQQQKPNEGNCYGKSESASLDENIQAEIDDRGGSTILAYSLFWCFYHLAHCYIETDQLDKAKELILDFAAACEQVDMTGQSSPELVFSLLGYTYKALKDYKAASCAFHRASQLRSNYELAENNQMLCDAMALSLDTE